MVHDIGQLNTARVRVSYPSFLLLQIRFRQFVHVLQLVRGVSWRRCEGERPGWWGGLEGYSYEDRLRILGLTTLETRFLRADLIQDIERVWEFGSPGEFGSERFFQVILDGVVTGHSFKLFKKRYRLDVGKFKFASRVCEEWNRLGDGIVWNSATFTSAFLPVSVFAIPDFRILLVSEI